MSLKPPPPPDMIDFGWGEKLAFGTYTFLAINISGIPNEFREDTVDQRDQALAISRIASVASQRGSIVFAEGAPRFQVVLAFKSAWDAIQTVSDYYALENPDFVSMGISVGVTFGDTPATCFPLLKSQALADFALGGQVLLSASTFEVLRDGAPIEWDFEDLGTVHLAFQLRRERVIQLLHPSLPSIRAFLQTEERVRPALPHRFGLLVGRDELIEQAHGPLARFPVVTLTGSAGIGKSHIASKLAVQLQGDGEDVVWVNLTGVATEEEFFAKFAEAVGLRGKNFPIRPLVLRQLSGREIRFVLDGCDRCVSIVKEFVSEAIRTSGPTFLITSPKRLGLGADKEETVPVLPLPIPAVDVVWSSEDLEEHDATALFMDRAREANPRFAVNGTEAHAVAKLCNHFRGHPLSILLAAKRSNQLSPSQMLFELNAIEGTTRKGHKGQARDARHSSLQGALDWTYGVLNPDAKRVLQSLTPVRGRWDRRLAATLADLHDDEIRLPIEELIDSGLIEPDQTAHHGDYFRLPVAVAQLLATKFDSDEAKEACYEQHCLAMIGILAETASNLGSESEVAALDRFDDQKADVFAALEFTLRPGGHLKTFTEALIRSWSYWYKRNQIEDALRLIDLAVKRYSSEESLDLGRVLNFGGALATKAGLVERAERYLRRASRVAKKLQHSQFLAVVLSNQGMLKWSIDRCEEALRDFEGAVANLPEATPDSIKTNIYASWFTSLLDAGHISRAEGAFLRARHSQTEKNDHQQNWMLAIGEGQLMLRKGLFHPARLLFLRSLEVAEEISDHACLARSAYWLAEYEFRVGSHHRAAQLLGFTRTSARRSGIKLYPVNETRIACLTKRCDAALGSTLLRQEMIAGSLLSVNEIMEDIKTY